MSPGVATVIPRHEGVLPGGAMDGDRLFLVEIGHQPIQRPRRERLV